MVTGFDRALTSTATAPRVQTRSARSDTPAVTDSDRCSTFANTQHARTQAHRIPHTSNADTPLAVTDSDQYSTPQNRYTVTHSDRCLISPSRARVRDEPRKRPDRSRQ